MPKDVHFWPYSAKIYTGLLHHKYLFDRTEFDFILLQFSNTGQLSATGQWKEKQRTDGLVGFSVILLYHPTSILPALQHNWLTPWNASPSLILSYTVQRLQDAKSISK